MPVFQCYPAYSCPKGPQSVAKPVKQSVADTIVPNIAIELNAQGKRIDALEIDTQVSVESEYPHPIIDSGTTDCAEAREQWL